MYSHIAIVKSCSGLFQGLFDLVYPPVCGICKFPADSPDRLFCQNCYNRIEGFDYPYCIKCRAFIMSGLTCQTCKPAPLTIVSLGYFDENLRTIIHDLKFYGLKPVAATLGYKLADVILESVPLDYFDAIVPVPLHYSRLEKRGFNQAEEIALSIGACLNIPVYSNLLIMTRKTKQQARLSASERILNVCDAFTVKDETGILQGKKILLVDDVTTTGATLLENCKALKAAGAGKVISAVAATAV